VGVFVVRTPSEELTIIQIDTGGMVPANQFGQDMSMY
jgi:hypothetical protein